MSPELEPWTDEEIDAWLDERWHIGVMFDRRVNLYNTDDSWYEYMTPRTIERLCARLMHAAEKAAAL